MSVNALRNDSFVDGNTVRKLPAALPGGLAPSSEPKPQRNRTPLSLVVSVPKRSTRPLFIAVFLIVLAAMAAVLIMSVSLSKGQYRLVELKGQQTTIANANQALELELSAKNAPQSLVAQATKLGMVPATSTGQIDVRTKKVTGNPLPAKADTKGLVQIAPADVNKPKPVSEAATPVSNVDTTPKEAAKTAQQQAQAAAAAAAAAKAEAARKLNGGTIPAPTQKDS